jgi:4-amino-4-deoxy-L-arabinose transferase-like glycosyltransferase
MSSKNFIKSPYLLLFLALFLFFPAFMINLEDQPIIEDEAIRSLVAFEMYKSGDYITPTIGGDPYLRKPPLYNWFIAGSFGIFGNYSETAIRFPMVISLLLFSLTIFFIVRKEFGDRMGILNALIFITLGRILLYESLHGLIDIAFSWLTYLFFMLSYTLFRRKQYLSLFLAAYLITAITWLMKGIPALVFTGISLLVLFISYKQFKMLFNWRHFAGIGLFLALLSAYYFVYFTINNLSPEKLFGTLFEQTTRRTVVRYGILDTIQHLFMFPVEMLYHFLPWTILTLALFAHGMLKKIWSSAFLRYNILILAFNIIVYWTSPEVYPRYILMLVPLYFTVVSYAYTDLREQGHIIARIIEYVFGILLIVFILAPYASLFLEVFNVVNSRLLISILLSVSITAIAIIYWRSAKTRLLWLAISLLVLRIGFDLIVLPTRQHNTVEVLMKESAIALAEQTSDEELYCYWNPEYEPDFYYNRGQLKFRFHYYLSSARDRILYNSSERMCGPLVISHPDHVKGDSIIIVGEARQNLEDTAPFPLFRFHSKK